ncbi:MAG: hypothetical protein NDI82_12265 [Anaeromyxobacteraceae bacterium]|nr:hypothetical protein [Anaeromyxobacteraceae bacterium]
MRPCTSFVTAALASLTLAGCGPSAPSATDPGATSATDPGASSAIDPGATSPVEARAAGATGCGPLVHRRGDTITVAPSGGEDTAALQCALDLAVAAGRPVTVALAAGEFRSAQLVATGFHGRLRGAGMDRTTLRNLDGPLPVDPDWLGDVHPTAAYPWPVQLSFVEGAVAVSDLRFLTIGERPIADYSYYNVMVAQVALVGEAVTARFERVRFEGEPFQAYPGFAANAFNGITTWEAAWFSHPPMALRLSVERCDFGVGLGSGVNLNNLRGAAVSIAGSAFSGTAVDALEIVDVDRSAVSFLGNTVEAPGAAVTTYEVCSGAPAVCGITGSRLLFAGNRVEAFDGFNLGGTIGEGTACAIVGNRVTPDAVAGGHGVHLGPEVSGCLVAGSGTVLDEGTGNLVVGGR